MFQYMYYYNVVMLFPEISEQRLSYLALLLRNMYQLYMAQNNNILPVDWSLGILFYVHKFPMDK